MASVIVTDETVVVVPAAALRSLLAESSRWQVLWPGSRAVLVTSGVPGRLEWRLSGALMGGSWVLLEDRSDGVLVQYRLEADPAEPGTGDRPRELSTSPHGRREVAELRRRHLLAWKRSLWAVVDEYQQVVSGRGAG